MLLSLQNGTAGLQLGCSRHPGALHRTCGRAATASTPLDWPLSDSAQQDALQGAVNEGLRERPARAVSTGPDQAAGIRPRLIPPRRRQPQHRALRADEGRTQQASSTTDGPSTSGREHYTAASAPWPQPQGRARIMPLPRSSPAASTSSMDVELEALIWAIASARGSSGNSWSTSGRGSSGSTSLNSTGGIGPSAAAAAAVGGPAQHSWTPDSLLAALDLALPDMARTRRSEVAAQQGDYSSAAWSDTGGAEDARSRSHSGSGLASVLLPALVAPASNLHPPSSSLTWSPVGVPEEVSNWLDASAVHADLGEARSDTAGGSGHGSAVLAGPGSSPHGPLPQPTSFLSSQTRGSPTPWRGAEPGLADAGSVQLMGPLAAEGPALASLMCAAAGVAWLTPTQQQQQAAGDWGRAPSATVLTHTAVTSSFNALDPALEWALAVLSTRVSPAEPAAADVRLANRTFAAHVRRAGGLDAARPESHTHVFSSGVPAARQAPSTALPWQVLQPLLTAVGNRLSPCSALALLQVRALA